MGVLTTTVMGAKLLAGRITAAKATAAIVKSKAISNYSRFLMMP